MLLFSVELGEVVLIELLGRELFLKRIYRCDILLCRVQELKYIGY